MEDREVDGLIHHYGTSNTRRCLLGLALGGNHLFERMHWHHLASDIHSLHLSQRLLSSVRRIFGDESI